MAVEILKRSDGPHDVNVTGRGLGKGVWGMIEESVLARSLREKDGREVSLFSVLVLGSRLVESSQDLQSLARASSTLITCAR